MTVIMVVVELTLPVLTMVVVDNGDSDYGSRGSEQWWSGGGADTES